MRISQQTIMDNSLRRLTTRLESFNKVQEQLASGKVIQRPSDDAAAMNRALMLRADQRLRTQEGRNAEDGQTWTQLGDTQLQSALDRARRARDLLVQSRSGALSTSDRAAIADELTSIQQDLVGIANAKHLDKGLFSGTAGGDAVTKVAGAWTYTGDNGQVRRRISDSEVVTVNQTGDEVFGFALGTGNDIFSTLDQAIQAVTTGDDAGMAAGLQKLDAATDSVQSSLGTFGAVQSQIEVSISRNRDASLSIQSQLSETEDTDFAKAVLQLQTEQVAYQATLGAVSRAIQPSLVDFLK
jgi:flagellar hook-associated protein 3 FlgL